MKEIEVKARLKNREVVIENLKKLGCEFEEAITQRDVVYVKNVGSEEIYNANDVFLRIRIKNNQKAFFTLKKPLTNDLDVLEHETEITNAKQMAEALVLMGYQDAVHINKTRIITHYDGCEICIDDVEVLGSFIEMEKLTTDADAEKVQTELFTFLTSVGVDPSDRVLIGYDTLMRNHIASH